MRGFVFLSLLFVASLLLSPDSFLALMPQRCQLWIVRRWTAQRNGRLTLLLITVFMLLSGWLFFGDSRRVPQTGSKPLRVSRPILMLETGGRRVRP
ncbi:MAG TPA: hypothetical protein VKU01_33790 [Bryobacteraceae bacterium]|nr:hypothetical protein [Bryobacteraceae bacterium]